MITPPIDLPWPWARLPERDVAIADRIGAMRIAIAGGHGRIALLLIRTLTERGHSVLGIIRNPEQAADVRAAGAEPAVLDLEHAGPEEVVAVLPGVDVLVFAAGAGPGSGIARKYTVDQGASDLCVSAARQAQVPRFVQISAMGTDHPPQDDSVFAHYLRAKAAAERTVRQSGLSYVILRPGRLTDDPPSGSVALARHIARGSVSRSDVAAVTVGIVERPDIRDVTLELVAGPQRIAEALDALGAQ